MNQVTAKSYTLYTEAGHWLGQIVLTSDGMFASVTDYGNLSYTWGRTGCDDFREFLISLNVEYFAGKVYNGMAYGSRKKLSEGLSTFRRNDITRTTIRSQKRN